MAEQPQDVRSGVGWRARPAIVAGLTVAALGLGAIWPLFRQPALACTDDLGFHLLRLTQLDHLLRHGVLYSRWAPDMALGYGFPFFNFYAPLAYYLAALVSALGPGLNLGLRLTFALGILGSGWATYRLARDHFRGPAALAAAVAVMYAPYHGYDVYFRGNLAEALAWPFLALALWVIGRLARRGVRFWLPLTALAGAAVLLTHNVFALIFLPLLGLYGAAEAWFGAKPAPQRGPRLKRLAAVTGGLLLALALGAFFWLPALAEQRYVHIDRLLVPPVFVYWNNFISLRELLALPIPVRPDLLNPSPPRGLGLAPVLLALPGLAGLWRWRGAGRRQVAFFGAATLVYAFLMTGASEPVWSAIPLLQFVQFPWRLLGPAAICLAMLIAAGVDLLLDLEAGRLQRWGGLVSGVAIAALLLSSLFWFDPRYCGGLEAPQIADVVAYEQATDTIGTTAKGEYLPRTVQLYPPQPAPAPGRFAAPTLPASVALLAASDEPLRATAILETEAPAQVIANVFAYPGWRVLVDGEPAPVTPEAEYGRVTFPLPAGRHEVALRFGETPLRLAADLISAAAWLALVLLFWRFPPERARERPPADGHGGAGYLLLGLALFGLVAGVLPRTPNPFYRGGGPDLQQPRDISYQGGLRWLGFNRAAAEPVAPGQAARFDLFWTATAPPAANYQTTLHLVDEEGQLWSDKDTARPRDLRPAPPTSLWTPGQIALDSHLLAPLPGTPPGTYDVRLLLFDQQTLQPAGAQENPSGEVTADQLVVARPEQPATLAELQPQFPAEAAWGPLRLLGYNLDRAEAAPGDPFLLTLFWQAEEAPGDDYRAELSLLGPPGDAVLERRLPLVRAGFPSTSWQAGDTWRGQHALRLPPGLGSGVHRWELVLCSGANVCQPAGAPLDLGTLLVHAPQRRFDTPDVALALNARLGQAATLLGADLSADELRAGEPLVVELVWRAEQETETNYHIFLHLLGPEGTVIAQSDGEPASWTRPTTGWLAGEIIVDERQLLLPEPLAPGDYHLVAGLYEPASGERLLLPDGDGAATIRRFTVVP